MKQFLVTCMLSVIFVHNVYGQTTAIPATPPPTGDLCWNRPQIAEALETYSFEDFIAQVDSGRGLFGSVDVVGASSLLGSWTYQIPVMETTEVTLMYYTPETDTYELDFTVLLNEQVLADQPVPQRLLLQPETIHEFSVILPPLPDGIHTLTILTKNRLAESFPGQISSSSANRLTLVAGNTQSLRPLPFIRLPAAGRFNEADPFWSVYLELMDQPDGWARLAEPYAIEAGSVLNFDILAGYNPTAGGEQALAEPIAVSQFALVGLLNGQQIPLRDDAAVLYIEVDNITAYARIPVAVKLPLDIGLHELTVVRIDNPGVATCVLDAAPNGVFYSKLPTFVTIPLNLTAPG